MIFRLSNKLKDRIKVASLETSPPMSTPSWTGAAHLFFVGAQLLHPREQHEISLLRFVARH